MARSIGVELKTPQRVESVTIRSGYYSPMHR
jgi:hypothetical protein